MSLINQALKKRQRDGAPAPVKEPVRSQPEPAAFRPTHAESQPGYKILYWVVGGGILIAGIVAAVALTIVLMTPGPQAVEAPVEKSIGMKVTLKAPPPVEVPAAQTSAVPPAQSVAVPVAPAVQPQVETPSAPPAVAQTPVPPTEPVQTAVAAQVPAAPMASKPPVAVPVTPPAQQNPTPVATTESTPAAKPALASQQPVKVGKAEDEKPEPPPPAEPIPGAEPNPKVLAFLESSRITGIRIAGKKSLVLMNNQVLKVDSIVQPETKLRITEIKPNEILFVDESGIQYRKQFQR